MPAGVEFTDDKIGNCVLLESEHIVVRDGILYDATTIMVSLEARLVGSMLYFTLDCFAEDQRIGYFRATDLSEMPSIVEIARHPRGTADLRELCTAVAACTFEQFLVANLLTHMMNSCTWLCVIELESEAAISVTIEVRRDGMLLFDWEYVIPVEEAKPFFTLPSST